MKGLVLKVTKGNQFLLRIIESQIVLQVLMYINAAVFELILKHRSSQRFGILLQYISLGIDEKQVKKDQSSAGPNF